PAPSPADDDLRERLRTWRRERAAADGVPAFVVFADRTLDALVTARPRTPAELLAVPGIGPTKLERYGEAILAVLWPPDPAA
ncbi:MAG: ATP-dependent DNA helicase, partial [Actinomyces sp.]